MTNAPPPTGRFTDGEFRIGHVFSQSWSVLSQNIFKICLVTSGAILPLLLISLLSPANVGGSVGGPIAIGPAGVNLSSINLFAFIGSLAVIFLILMVVFNLSEAMVLYIAVEHASAGDWLTA